jgi:hypothetical protein
VANTTTNEGTIRISDSGRGASYHSACHSINGKGGRIGPKATMTDRVFADYRFRKLVLSRLAKNTAGSGLGPWYLARAKALSVGLSNAHFKSLGLPSLFEEVSA